MLNVLVADSCEEGCQSQREDEEEIKGEFMFFSCKYPFIFANDFVK